MRRTSLWPSRGTPILICLFPSHMRQPGLQRFPFHFLLRRSRIASCPLKTDTFNVLFITNASRSEVVNDPQEAQRALIQIIHNCGFALLFVGLNPLTLADEKILAKRRPEVVVRICPTQIVGGSLDPGHQGWILPNSARLVFTLWLGWIIFRRTKELMHRSR
jgi:hypothetical protein